MGGEEKGRTRKERVEGNGREERALQSAAALGIAKPNL